MEVMEKLKEHKEEVDKRLSKYFNEKLQHAVMQSESIEYVKELSEIIKEFNLRGGKRLRPSFIVEGYKCVGGTDIEAIYDASLAIETMEGFLLIHDDVMDQDDLRRGGKTVHKIYREWYKNKLGGPEEKAVHFGNNIAINAGDIVETFGPEIIANSSFPDELKIKAIKEYTKLSRYTGYGQVLDIIVGQLPLDNVTEQQVLTVHTFKTALYSVIGPLQIGAVLGGANQEQIDLMEKFGKPLGVAFQIQDDLLGMFGDEQKLGKAADSDIKEGKRTLLTLKAYQNGTQEQKEKIMKVLGNREATKEEIQELRNIVKETGSYDYSKEKAINLVKEAKEAINNSNFTQEGKNYLLGIADYLINREI